MEYRLLTASTLILWQISVVELCKLIPGHSRVSVLYIHTLMIGAAPPISSPTHGSITLSQRLHSKIIVTTNEFETK